MVLQKEQKSILRRYRTYSTIFADSTKIKDDDHLLEYPLTKMEVPLKISHFKGFVSASDLNCRSNFDFLALM